MEAGKERLKVPRRKDTKMEKRKDKEIKERERQKVDG